MPLIEDSTEYGLSLGPGYGAQPDEPVPHAPSALEVLGAAWRQVSDVGSLLSKDKAAPFPWERADKSFDPFEHIPEDKKLFATKYANAKSLAQVDGITRQIDMELKDRETLQSGGLLGVAAGLGAGLVSPIMLLPGLGFEVKGGSLVANVFKNGLRHAAYGAGAMSLNEALLHASQKTRTLEESAWSVAGGTFLGGLFGGAGSAWSHAAQSFKKVPMESLGAQVEKEMNIPKVGRFSPEDVQAAKAHYEQVGQELDGLKAQGVAEDTEEFIDTYLRHQDAKQQWETMAAEEHQLDPLEPGYVHVPDDVAKHDTENSVFSESMTAKHLQDKYAYEHADGRVSADYNPSMPRPIDWHARQLDNRVDAEGVIKRMPIINHQDPLIRTTLSPSLETRRVIQGLAETPLKYEKNALGIPTDVPVEASIRQSRAPLAKALRFLDEQFQTYRLGRVQGKMAKERIALADKLVGAGDYLTEQEFKDAVGMAMRRGDVHEIPEVAAVAKHFRENVFSPLLEKAVALDMLPHNPEIKTAPSYLTRLWDVEKIIAKRDEFFQKNLEWLKVKEAKKPVGSQRTEQELADITDQLIDRILGTPAGRMPYDVLDGEFGDAFHSTAGGGGSRGMAKPFHKRLYDIPDEMVEEFLHNDIEHVAKVYERSMAPDLGLVERFGSLDLENEMQAIRRDYAAKQHKATTVKERVELKKLMDRDLKDITAIRDRLRGTYGLPSDPNSYAVRAGKALRTLNFLSLMGGVAISSIPDLARPMMVHGLQRYMTDGLIPLLTDFKTLRLAADEVKLAGTALDMLLDGRMMDLGSMMDDFGRGTKLERLISGAAHNFGPMTGINQWTAAMKQFAGVMTQTRMIEAALATKAGTVSAKEMENLAASYISPAMAKRIAGQFEKYGDSRGNVHLPNTGDWTDREAVRIFRAALAKDVDRIIVTPGVGDKPLWLSSELGKLVFQFKSFFISSAQRVFLAGLQQRDMAVLHGTVFGAGLGILSGLLSDEIKVLSGGRRKERTPAQWILEGLDRAGVGGWLFEINNIAEKLTRGTWGLSPMFGKEPMSRYQSRNVLDSLLGPSAGRIEDAARVIGKGGAIVANRLKGKYDENWSQADVRAMRRIMPFQNLFYLRWLFDQGEKGLGQALGVKENDYGIPQY